MAQAPIYVEVPDFGFGPACGFLDGTEPFAGSFEWNVLTSGNAAKFIKSERPECQILPFDGFHAENWPLLPDLVPPESIVLSISNPPFAAHAALLGHHTGLLDQLDWMWEALPEGIDALSFHLSQTYFGVRSRTAPGPSQIEVAPVVSSYFQGQRPRNRSGTLTSFGGMAIAGVPDATDDYAHWLLSCAVPLLDSADAYPAYVVGGSPNLERLVSGYGDRDVKCMIGLGRHAYAELLRTAQHQILSPGLASIFEAEVAGASPLFSPGSNKSMVLQLEALHETGYKHVSTWPWHATIVNQISTMPQVEALEVVSKRIEASMADPSGRSHFETDLESYLGRDHDCIVETAWDRSLPTVGGVLERQLRWLTTSRN